MPASDLLHPPAPTTTAAPQATADQADGLPPVQRRKAVVVILLGLVLVVLDGSIVTLALPKIARAFDVPAASAVWVVTGYQLAVLGLLLPMASLGERLGYRRVYLWGMGLFACAALLCALAPALWLLVLCRAAQGVAGAAVMGVNAALVRQVYPSALLGRGIALNAMTVAMAAVAGPALASLVLSLLSWHWLFALGVPLALAVVLLGRRHLPVGQCSGRTPFSALDWLLNILAFGLLFWAVDALAAHGLSHWLAHGHWGWHGRLGAAVLGLSLLLWIWHVRRQRRLPEPLLPLDLLRIPVFALSMCASVMAFAAQMLSFIALPFLSLSILHHAPWQTGLLVSMWPLAIALVAPWAGRSIGRFPGAVLGALGMLVLAAGLLLLALLPLHAPLWALGCAAWLCGAGFGLFQSPNNHIILTAGPRTRSGAAGGMLGTARLTGQSLGAALAAGVFTLWPPPHYLGGPQTAFALAAGCALLAALASVLRRSRFS